MLAEVFRSLVHPRFRHYFIGQAVSAIGFWVQQVALSWTVYQVTGSAAMLGAVAFASSIPILIVSPVAGALVDRMDRKRVVIATQLLQMGQAFALAALVFTGSIGATAVLALALLNGIAWTFDAPARQALLPVMIGGRAELPNAIALNSLVMNLARFVGPVLGGALLAWAGEGWCFLFNGFSFLAVILVLRRLPTVPAVTRPRGRWRDELTDGLRWVWNDPPSRRLVLLLAVTSFTAPAYQTLMPIFARDVFGGDARLQGLLVSSAGAGALVGTAMLAWRHSLRGLDRVIARSALGAGLGLVAFAFAPTAIAAMFAVAVCGFGVIVTASGVNTMLQSTVDEHRRGRVVSVYLMAFLGVSPLGNLVVGWLAQACGAQWALSAYGVGCALAASYAALSLRRRPGSLDRGEP